jgi:sulfonate transport system ATP-binding protein
MLAIKDVSKQFIDDTGVDHLAIDKINIQVDQHEIIALVGTSGCGKSTLLRILSGLDSPTTGQVKLNGQSVTEPSSDIAMVFQEPRLMPWLSVTENIRLVLRDLDPDEQDDRIREALEKVNLWKFRDALPRQLSGGMAQRASIARALVRKPSILLLDEPFSALDNFTRAALQDHLIELWADSRFTLIFVTHDVEEAAILADRILVMRGHPGRVYEEIKVELPHPRERSSSELIALKKKIVAALDLSHA